MTAIEYAFYRFVRTLMTPTELKSAMELADEAEAGDENAEAEFRALAERVFFDRARIKAQRD